MRYFITALLLHAALLGIVLVGVFFHPVRRPEPVIEAVLVSPKPPKAQAAVPSTPPPQTPAEPPKKPETKPEPKSEPKPDPKLAEDAQKKQKQAELQRKVELEKEQKLKLEQEKEKKRVEAEKKLKQLEEQERKKQLEEEEARRLQEDQRKQKEAEKKRQQELSDMLEQEREGRVASERSRWAALIQDKVRRNWIRPNNSVDKFQCSVNVQILPGGSIVNVKLNGSCGSPVLDESVKRAVLKSDPLPMPTDPSVFDRNLNFTFVPGTN